MSDIKIINWANNLGVTEPVNGSWIEAIAQFYSKTQPENGTWMAAIANALGVTPSNGSFIQAIAEHYGATAPLNGSWIASIADLATAGSSLWDNLQSYYTADNTANDALGNYNGILTNGASYTTGKINQGFNLDGANDYVDMGSKQIWNNTQSFTYSAWIYANDIRNRTIVSGGNTTNGGASLGIWSNGVTRNIALLVGPGTSQFIGNTALSLSTWHHLVAVHTPYDGVSANVQFYLDGTPDGSGILNIGSYTTSSNQRIGASTNSAGFFNGIIDEVAIWERALSASEVTELNNSGSALQYS